jgi:hypothetical protein
MKPLAILFVVLAACAGDHADALDSTDAPASAPRSCAAPAVIAPASGATTGTDLRVRTADSTCLTATKCYLDAQTPPIASGGAGLDVAFSTSVGAHTIQCNGWDASGAVHQGGTVTFTVAACGAPAILSPAPGEQVDTSFALETSAPACLTATKCYLDSKNPPIASGAAGAIAAQITAQPGAHTLSCNGWDATGQVYTSASTSFSTAGSMGSCGTPVSINSLTAHNTSAYPAYDHVHFPANVGTKTWVSTNADTITIDENKMDLSENPVTPGHVSNVDVHSLIPSRPDLRWFAHVVPWFGGTSHVNIGLDNNTAAYAASLVQDVARRGFDGIVIDWYGEGSEEDQATLKIQSYLDAHPELGLKLILMIDKGVANLSQSVLVTQLHYMATQYFHDSIYELEGGKPLVMFFGVEAKVGAAAMAAVKASDGGGQVWVLEGQGALADSYADQVFDWANVYTSGPNATDPYNLGALASFHGAVAKSQKHAFGGMMAGFNGMLTHSVAWSQGKYIPRGHGACLVKRAAKIAQVIPANVTRMQWVTWSDWEEGTQVETGVANDIAVTATQQAGVLHWTVSGGTGDESTIDHYDVYVSSDGSSASLVGSVPVGTHAFTLGQCTAHGTAAVIAVGKPMIRNASSAWVAF